MLSELNANTAETTVSLHAPAERKQNEEMKPQSTPASSEQRLSLVRISQTSIVWDDMRRKERRIVPPLSFTRHTSSPFPTQIGIYTDSIAICCC